MRVNMVAFAGYLNMADPLEALVREHVAPQHHALCLRAQLNGRLLLLLDGLDECSILLRARVLEFFTRQKQLIVLLTTRFSGMNAMELRPLGFEPLQVCAPSPEQAAALLGHGNASLSAPVNADPLCVACHYYRVGGRFC